MKKFFSLNLLLLLISASLIIGCDNNDNGITEDDSFEPTSFLTSLNVSINGQKGVLKTGDLPYENNNEIPTITSLPNILKTAKLVDERIDLVFEIDSTIEEVYFSVDNTSEYYTFNNLKDVNGAKTQAISIIFKIPSSVDKDKFTMDISVKDKSGSFSDRIKIDCTINENKKEERIIYFSDFSENATLSTLNFNTGKVKNIGAIGYKLSDVAFFNDKLYGVTLDSKFISIDLESGKGTFVGNIGGIESYGINALEEHNGKLYGATALGKFISIDPTTGKGTEINPFEFRVYSSGDLVSDKNGDFLYASLIFKNLPTDVIAKIDPKTGKETLIGETGFNKVHGLAFLRGQLLGLTNDGEFIIINTNTGEGTHIENTDAFSASGAAAMIKN